MTWPTDLLENAERFVMQTVGLGPGRGEDGSLADRLDVLERVIELLRIRSGRVENALTMDDLLGRGLLIEPPAYSNTPPIFVGRHADSPPMPPERPRRQSELQVALLVHLLHARSQSGRIGDDLHRFILGVGGDLAPTDVETTETGVMRIATTTRSAARTLRMFGLLRDTDETRTRTWELSVLGILVAVELSRSMPTLALPQRNAPTGSPNALRDSESMAEYFLRHQWFSEGIRLADPVAASVRHFRDDAVVRAALLRLCADDSDVFPSFATVVRTVARYCAALDDGLEHAAEQREKVDPKALRRAADEMLAVVESAVRPSALAEDVNKSLSLRQA